MANITEENKKIIVHISEYKRTSKPKAFGFKEGTEEKEFAYGFSETEAYGFVGIKDIRS